MKKILLLGASGSIGQQSLKVIDEHPDELKLVGASVGANKDFLCDLLNKYNLSYVYLINQDKELETKYPSTKFYYGEDGLNNIVKEDSYDLLVNALVGFVGFVPTLKAIENHKDIALANKETLVAGGEIIIEAIKQNKVKLFPIDSEHSAILQSLQGHQKEDIKRLIITGSGGSFRNKKRDELKDVSLSDALKHPNWAMGAKITIDSATMMNKGFEVIEAHYLFDIPYDKIDVILHDESIVHSLVEYNDGSLINQMGSPDMCLPIKYALLYPRHLNDSNNNPLLLEKVGQLHFKEMDYERYPLVKLAKEVGTKAGNLGAALIGANDAAVKLFIDNKISFLQIEDLVFAVMKEVKYIKDPNYQDIIDTNNWAKQKVIELTK